MFCGSCMSLYFPHKQYRIQCAAMVRFVSHDVPLFPFKGMSPGPVSPLWMEQKWRRPAWRWKIIKCLYRKWAIPTMGFNHRPLAYGDARRFAQLEVQLLGVHGGLRPGGVSKPCTPGHQTRWRMDEFIHPKMAIGYR